VLRFLIDHDFNERVLRGVRSRAKVDAVPARTVGLAHKSDPELLSWAAAENRILVSHDIQTMPRFAIARVRAGESMPGLILVPQDLRIGKAIEELATIVQCSSQTEWQDLIVYVPL
jgi:predicted nuclease of predicted toxin-antitoxin system